MAAGLPIGTTNSVVNYSTETELACRDNELGYMFYHTPGGNLGTDLTGTQTISDVTLTNTQLIYWPGTDVSTTNAWRFDFRDGIQDNRVKGGNLQFGWNVADGDVFVPIPPAIWLFGSGLLGLVGVARKKAA